jgi:hypothetical protein
LELELLPLVITEETQEVIPSSQLSLATAVAVAVTSKLQQVVVLVAVAAKLLVCYLVGQEQLIKVIQAVTVTLLVETPAQVVVVLADPV